MPAYRWVETDGGMRRIYIVYELLRLGVDCARETTIPHYFCSFRCRDQGVRTIPYPVATVDEPAECAPDGEACETCGRVLSVRGEIQTMSNARGCYE